VIAIAVVTWPPVARLVRGEFLAMRHSEFIEACIVLGMRDAAIIFREILPNCLSPIMVTGSLMVATAILIESALAFLGLGDPNVMSWGFIGAGRTFLRTAWWLCAILGLAILLTVLAINLVGEGLNDALNPRLRDRWAVADALLSIDRLTVAPRQGADRAHAVEAASLEVGRNEILCLVGESGSGKSVMARAVMRLLPEPRLRVASGRILFEGGDVLAASPARMRNLRGGRMAMIFQEPMTALNPLMSIGWQIEEVIATDLDLRRRERRGRIVEMLRAVHLPTPEVLLQAYPHQLSGGQRQRAMIAMALILGPALIIADEPTTALDVTQAQILSLIRDLQAEHHSGILFITHDLRVAAQVCDRLAVMHRGRIVDHGSAAALFGDPQHPYARQLLASIPGRHWTPPASERSA
jgi:ABC-type dipeptide/oligopeptide/nickel transport system ATPase component